MTTGSEPRHEDRRQYPRVPERSRVTVTVLSAPDAPEIESRSFFCWTSDLSVGGLKFCVHSPVPVGSLLKLEVRLENPFEMFLHFGKVMWEQEIKDEDLVSVWLGVRISETLGGEARMAVWRRCLESKLASVST